MVGYIKGWFGSFPKDFWLEGLDVKWLFCKNGCPPKHNNNQHQPGENPESLIGLYVYILLLNNHHN